MAVRGKAKRPPKMGVDPLSRITSARKAAEAASRKPTVKGTFTQGTKSASSSNAGKNTNQRRGSGGGTRRDSKGRFT